MYKILMKCSEKAAKKIKPEAIQNSTGEFLRISVAPHPLSKYPTADQRVGMSFALPLDMNEKSLRSYFSVKGRLEGRKYTIVCWEDCYEVARIA